MTFLLWSCKILRILLSAYIADGILFSERGDADVKKIGWKILYFLPAITLLAIVLAAEGITAIFTAPKTMINILVLFTAGVAMSKGKVWGAFMGIGYGVFWIAFDIISAHIRGGYRLFPIEYVCIPLIIYYIYCAIAVKKKPKDE